MAEHICTLKDEAGSSLSVELRFQAPDSEGWRPFQIQLRRRDQIIIQCREEILSSEITTLADKLRGTAQNGQRISWAPTEPSFLVWAHKYPSGMVEITVMIDDGVAEDKPTTDTGVALVLHVSADSAVRFADTLID